MWVEGAMLLRETHANTHTLKSQCVSECCVSQSQRAQQGVHDWSRWHLLQKTESKKERDLAFL